MSVSGHWTSCGPQGASRCRPSSGRGIDPKPYTSGPVWDGPASPRQPWALPTWSPSPDVSAIPSPQPTTAFFTAWQGQSPRQGRNRSGQSAGPSLTHRKGPGECP